MGDGVEGTAVLGAAVGMTVKLGVGVGMTVEVAWTVGLGVVSGTTAVEVGVGAVEVTAVSWPPQATKMANTPTIPNDAIRMHRLPNPPTYFSCPRMRQPPCAGMKRYLDQPHRSRASIFSVYTNPHFRHSWVADELC